MSCIKFLTESFIDSDTNLILATESSEQTDFPLENVLNKQRRSKAWRTNGFYTIESGSNTIVFQENGSTDLTATITAGDYTSRTALEAAVKAALEAESTNSVTYTVDQDSNFKTTITSDGNGGATLDILWTDANSADMAAILGFDTASDSTGSLSYTADVIVLHTEEYVIFDLGIASNPHELVICGPDRNKSLQLSPDSTIKLQGSPTNNFTGTPPIDLSITYNEEILYYTDDNGFDSSMVGARFWKLKIVDEDNPLGYIPLGAIYLGDHAFSDITTRGAGQFPFNFNPTDRSEVIFSEGGQTFSDKQPQSENFSITFSGLDKTECERFIDVFRIFGKITPFFIVWDSDSVFSSSANRFLRYVQFDKEPSFSLTNPDFFTMQLSLREAL